MRLSLCDIFVKDIRHYFSVEAEQGMEHASCKGSQVDRVGQPGKTADDTSTETQQTVKYVDLVRSMHMFYKNLWYVVKRWYCVKMLLASQGKSKPQVIPP